jgi:MacB-like periplasmic core domain
MFSSSANFFHVLGIEPIIGREFTRAEDVPGGPPLTILSYGLWQRVFRGDPSIVGRTIDLRGAPHTVVGIMPPGFRTLPAGFGTNHPQDLWTPLQPSRFGKGSRDNYGVIARLKPGVTFVQANGQLASMMGPLIAELHLPSGVSMQEKALPLQAGITSDVRSKMNLMWALSFSCYSSAA